jgi:hypothetical protein
MAGTEEMVHATSLNSWRVGREPSRAYAGRRMGSIADRSNNLGESMRPGKYGVIKILVVTSSAINFSKV